MSQAAASWIDRISLRLPGRRGPHAGPLRLAQRNVYVLPTSAGLLYALVLFAMLIASINYALSLGYLLTFLLGAVAIVGMLQTFRNLSALELRSGRLEPVFAGSTAELHATVVEGRGHDRFALSLRPSGAHDPVPIDVPAGGEQPTALVWSAGERGRHPLPPIRISTRFPLGLWRAWAWWQPAGSFLVYPSPEPAPPALPTSQTQGGEGSGGRAGEEDLAALRAWSAGDSPRRIAWKAVARSGSDELLVKQFDGADGGELLLDWHALPAGLAPEARLSRLTAWVLEADAAGLRWGLRLPELMIEPGQGLPHRERCLEALALAQV
ncbi:MAG: DUF58 domain-containing protein [Betaproteobacteria bacterium]|nr:DUF58 domain-containing protein [Betaproteobacteria bacterium]